MASTEWNRGWRTVASGSVGMVFVGGVASVTGVVMAPLSEQFGWSRTLITSNIMICAVLTLLLAPLIGRMIARWGVRRCAIAGIIAAIPCLAIIALNPGSPVWWVTSWIIFGVINTLLGPLLWSTAVTELFDKARGLALAITLSGGGVAFGLFPPMALFVIQMFGWRGVYFILAMLFAGPLLLVILAWFHGRTDLHRGRPAEMAGQTVHAGSVSGLTLGQALRGRHFWQLALVCVLVAGVEGAMAIHLYPILNEGGLSPVAAAGVAAVMGWTMIVGRLGTGYLLDRLPARYVFAGAIAAILLSCVLAQIFTGNYPLGVLIATLLGLGSGGTINSLAYLTGRYFGLAAYAAIFGLLMGAFAVGYGIAPMLAAHARELLHSYPPLFASFVALAFLSIMLVLALGRGPVFANPEPS